MTKKVKSLLLKSSYIFVFLLVVSACSGSPDNPNYSTDWPKITAENKPWTRWWWLGNAVDSANLKANLEDLANAGIGGVEITPLYGVKGYEDKFIEHLSPRWMNMLEYTVDEAHNLGMKVDMVQGTGWPFGGPHVTPQYAASKLIVQTYTVGANSSLTEKLIAKERRQGDIATLEAVLAFEGDKFLEDLISKVDDERMLKWTSPNKDVTLYAVFCGKTRQQVKRAAPGGEGLTLDHYSREALDAYLKPYEATIGKNGTKLRALFNDSYEVYGTTWTPDFLNKFETLRGYDLRPYIPLLVENSEGDVKERVLSDYRETISDLLLNNFLNPWRKWANDHGYLTKNQSHGSPGNLLDLYGAADIPECETFGSTLFEVEGLRRDSLDIRSADPDPVMLKFAASAANVNGKKLVSSESFTWLREHFRGALSHCKPELEQLFLSGVNHIFFHGTTYSPKEDQWPGWKFYASMNFHPNNPIWKDSPAFFEYITRCQSVLQNSESTNDLLIYWPIYDTWDDTESRLFMQLNVHEIAHWLYPTPFYKVSTKLADEGFTYDFVSDKGLHVLSQEGGMLKAKGEHAYKAIVLPKCELIPVNTFVRILALAERGATVAIQDFPEDVPGMNQLDSRRKELAANLEAIKKEMKKQNASTITWGSGKLIIGEDVAKLLHDNNLEGESIAQSGLDFIKKKFDGGYYYFVVNHTANTINEEVTFNESASSVVLMDALDGKTGITSFESKDGKTTVHLQLKSGETVFVKLLDKEIDGQQWAYYKEIGKDISIKNNWNVTFTSGGPVLPGDTTISAPESWTDWGTEQERFAGTAKYSTTFELPENSTNAYALDLGDVRETARVFINGDSVGIAWSNPYILDISQFVKPGNNSLEIEVTSLGANRIRDLDTRGVYWKKFYNTNIVTVAYKPFDASKWDPVACGLLGPVFIRPLEKTK